MENYPSTAYVLTLAGSILSLLLGILSIFIALSSVKPSDLGIFATLSGGWVCLVVIFLGSILGFLGAKLMKDPESVHTGGFLAIVAAFFSTGGIITFILLLLGGILALTWKKPEQKAVILPPPPPA